MGESGLFTRLPTKSSRPSADALFRLGLSLSTGVSDGQYDPISAHALFELAARMGSLEAKIYKRELGYEMDPAQVAESQQMVRAWLADP